jgi:hypothetical protein
LKLSRLLPSGNSGTSLVHSAAPEDGDARRASDLQRIVVFSISFALHVAALLVMAFIMLANDDRAPLLGILSSLSEPAEQELDLREVKIKQAQFVNDKDKSNQTVNKMLTKAERPFEIHANDRPPSAKPIVEPTAAAPAPAAPPRGYFGGRSTAGRSALVAKYGGTRESEAAVRAGLEWLARHQRADGSWSFDHHVYKCNCRDPGRFARSRMGATAMALLCFLGAGHTDSQGDFKQAVEKGLLFLLKNGKSTRMGGDFRGVFDRNSGMYVQGLVAIVLCEAFAMQESARIRESDDVISTPGKERPRLTPQARRQQMTKRQLELQRRINVSRRLFTASKTAVYFIANAQTGNGGWRYWPRFDADTSVTGWQVMALASADSADITVDAKTVRGISGFLDSVGTSRGDRYGYKSSRPTPPMTAVGLLCRIYLGWTREHPGIRYGVEYLSQLGPSRTNMYYNYYATQVLHQYGGELWTKWNNVMRDQLVDTQRTKGHAKGSWDVTDPHGYAGGRLYQTCLSIMTLEVYYRHLRLYEHRDPDTAGDKDSFARIAQGAKPGIPKANVIPPTKATKRTAGKK